MKSIYMECNAGVSGDMILGAMSDLLEDKNEIIKMLEHAEIPGIKVSVEEGETSNVRGNRVHVYIDGTEEGHEHCHHHEHRRLEDVLSVISKLNVSESVKLHATEIYRTIAEAEGKVHGRPVDLVHFHEVGALDAVADIVGACMLFEKLDIGEVMVSPIRIGYGQVECAHGMLPIPAPATANIL